MELRPSSEADFEAQLAVLDAAEGELRRRHEFPWMCPPLDVFAATHRHLLATDPDRSWVAEETGRVVGFTAALVRETAWFLSDLFVHPTRQARGLGSALLARAWGKGTERRITITDAIQPVSNALYARRGLVPATPVLELAGTAADRTFGRLTASPPEPDALAALDAAAYGFDRAPDHRFWASSARCTLWLRQGTPAAYSYVSPQGRIGPLAGLDAESAADALAEELGRLDGAAARVDIPGSSRELIVTALQAGLRISGPPGLLLLSPEVQAPRALAISGYWLF